MIADFVSVEVVVVVFECRVIGLWFSVSGFESSRAPSTFFVSDSLDRLLADESLLVLLSLPAGVEGWRFVATKWSAISVESFKSVKIAVPATRTPIEEGTALSRT